MEPQRSRRRCSQVLEEYAVRQKREAYRGPSGYMLFSESERAVYNAEVAAGPPSSSYAILAAILAAITLAAVCCCTTAQAAAACRTPLLAGPRMFAIASAVAVRGLLRSRAKLAFVERQN